MIVFGHLPINLMNHRNTHINTEINGKPGVVWGNLIVTASGGSKIKIKVARDLLQANIKLAYGLEKKRNYYSDIRD